MVVYIYYITAAGNSVSSQLGSSCHPVRATGTVRKRQPVRPVHHVQNHSWRVTPLQPARLASVLGQPSSLRPHWYAPLFLWLCTLLVSSCVNNCVTFSNLLKKLRVSGRSGHGSLDLASRDYCTCSVHE
jgi:hypothetical protein